jgi:hypothetical protein
MAAWLSACLLAGALGVMPALSFAQSDTASPQPQSDGQPLRNFFDWLMKPQPPRDRNGQPIKQPAQAPAVPAPAPSGSDAPAAAPQSAAAPAAQSVAAPGALPAAAPAAPPAVPTSPGAQPEAPAPTPSPAATPPIQADTTPVPPAPASPVPPPAAAPLVPRAGMALILPAKAEGFARAAEVTRRGFMVAREQAQDKSPLYVLETDGTAAGALAAYTEALAKNAAVVVGPLTKTEVGALAKEPIPVPTLMLNAPDGQIPMVPGLYMLSLSVELEARAAAESSFRPDAPGVVIVATPSPLSKRAAAAFSDAWTRMGGSIKAEVEFSGSLGRVKSAVDRARGDLVFLAADAERARLLRPFLGRNVNVIATSQVYSGAARLEVPGSGGRTEPLKINDLNGLRFVDMPWLHQPDHPAAMLYAHTDPPMAADLERLYALGIDAYRVAEQLARQRGVFELDGVTGRLAVHEGLIDRMPIQAEFREGLPVALDGATLAHGSAPGTTTGNPR